MQRGLALLLGLSQAACGTRDDVGHASDAAPESSADVAEDSPWIAPDAGDRSCATLAAGACNECCWVHHEAARTYVWDLLRTCECARPAPACVKECGPEWCKGNLSYQQSLVTQPKCEPCLDDNTSDACARKFSDGCSVDRECALVLECLGRCPTTPSPSDSGAD